MDEMESLSHPKWECKYHVVFIQKCRRKTLYGELRAPRRGIPQVGGAEGESDRRRALDAGSRAPDDCDFAKVCGIASDWVHQGQECDPLGAGVREEEEKLCGTAFLVERVLGVHGGPG